MFILANGAFKSGSTWMRNVLRLMTDYAEIPEQYQDPRFSTWVDRYKLTSFLDNVDYSTTNYISKSHIYSPQIRDKILAHDNLYVFNISRDVRDVLVSYYYHLLRERRIREGFDRFYWLLGRYKAYQIQQYHAVWDIGTPNIYVTSFEKMKSDFAAETAAMADFLGLALTDEKVAFIQEETSLARQQKERGEDDKPEHERFFRKGIIGDWKNHFTVEQLEDLQKIEADGLSFLDSVKYGVMFSSRQKFKELVQPMTKSWRG